MKISTPNRGPLGILCKIEIIVYCLVIRYGLYYFIVEHKHAKEDKHTLMAKCIV